MPSGDRTGPSGMGPGTGRAIGYCHGFDSPGYTKGPGRGMGRGGRAGCGRGMGRGQGFIAGRGHGSLAGKGRGFYAQGFVGGYHVEIPIMNKEEEARMLKSQIDYLSTEQKKFEQRLNKLGTE